MLSLIRRSPARFAGWPAVLRLCAVLWSVVLAGFSYSALHNTFGFPDVQESARRWRLVAADGNQLVAGAEWAFLTFAFFTALFVCRRLYLLHRWAAVVLSALSWYGVFMLSLGIQVWTVCLVSLIAIPLTVSTFFGWRQMRDGG